MSNSVPSGALGLSVFVILYTSLCLCLSALLFILFFKAGNRWTYVLFVCVFTGIAAAASLAQQIHYAVDFKLIRDAQAVARGQDLHSRPVSVVAGSSLGLDLWLFWIQYYTYNVDSLLILFWSLQLFKNTWRIRSKSLWLTDDVMERCFKAFSVIFPGLLFGIIQIDVISMSFVPYLFCCNIILLVSLLGGSIFLVLTLYKFIEARRFIAGTSSGSDAAHTATATGVAAEHHLSIRRSSDRWLIIRFTIAFILLSVFEVCQILFEVVAYNNNKKAEASTDPDYSVTGALSDIGQFVPAVTASLVAFLVWATTAPFRKQLVIWFTCGRGRNRVNSAHQGSGSVVNKLRTATSHAGVSADRSFIRMEDGSISDDNLDVKTGNIHVTTELSVMREDHRQSQSLPRDIEAFTWSRTELAEDAIPLGAMAPRRQKSWGRL